LLERDQRRAHGRRGNHFVRIEHVHRGKRRNTIGRRGLDFGYQHLERHLRFYRHLDGRDFDDRWRLRLGRADRDRDDRRYE
jgi:hypothetical protein